MLNSGACDHDYRDFTALQRLIETSPKPIDIATPTSEVIGCPSPTLGWSPLLEVELWKESPHHNHILFEEQSHSYIGCAVKQASGQTRQCARFGLLTLTVMVPALAKDFIGYSGMNNRDLERTRMHC